MHSIKLFKCTFISLINFDFKITKILKNRYFKMIQNPQFSSLRLKIFFMRSPYFFFDTDIYDLRHLN